MLLNNPAECARLGVNARLAYLDNYTAEVNDKQLFGVYSSTGSEWTDSAED